MSLKSNSQSDSLFAIITLLDDAELRTLADRCQNLIEARERIKREGLRQELMGNLQKAIGDILHNGFELSIKNIERNHEDDDFDEIWFDPKDIYSISITE